MKCDLTFYSFNIVSKTEVSNFDEVHFLQFFFMIMLIWAYTRSLCFT